MPRKKKTDTILSDTEKELRSLTDRKVELLNNLVQLEKNYNGLANPEIKNPEEWLYGLPIESLRHLSMEGKRRTRLGDVRLREGFKKSSLETIQELEVVDQKIRGLKLDLVSEKIKIALDESENHSK